MPLHTILFASSLFLIALFFALKEREVYAGRTTGFTRFMVRHSPVVEGFWNRCCDWISHAVRSFSRRLIVVTKNLASRVTITFRYIVVLLAGKMISAVRGEKFLEMKGAPSMHLKHLKEHRDTKNRDRDGSAS